MNTVILSLGTNLGNKLENLNSAIQEISFFGKVTSISSIYQTPPWGFKSDDFFNIALILKTTLTAKELIEKLQNIESFLGRKKSIPDLGYQARPIDIDIIFFNNEIINTKQLTVPHPRMQDRKFVLIPIIEIINNYIHPVLKLSLEDLLIKTNDSSEILKIQKKLIA